MKPVLRAALHDRVVDQHVVPKFCRVFVVIFQHIIETESFAKLDPDPVIRLGIAGRWKDLVKPDDAPVLGGAADFAFFDAGGGGQQIIGIKAGLVTEQINMNQQIKVFEGGAHPVLVWPCHHRVVRCDHRPQGIGVGMFNRVKPGD